MLNNQGYETPTSPCMHGSLYVDLGLILVMEFLETSDGRLKIESQPNDGSTLIMMLPLVKCNKE
jgi:light-regulated signal transduction histidine kinase (bacteriophytochrome)